VGNIVAVEKNTERQLPLKFTEHVLVWISEWSYV
jgi:hypothetical protein